MEPRWAESDAAVSQIDGQIIDVPCRARYQPLGLMDWRETERMALRGGKGSSLLDRVMARGSRSG